MRKKTKFVVLRSSIILAFAILAGRVWYLQVLMNGYYQAQADTSKIRLEPVQALRGIIYDRSGQPLVYNVPDWDVTIVPHGVPSRTAGRIYRQLSALLGNTPSPAAIASIVQDNLWRQYAPVLVKAHVSESTAMLIKQLHSRLPGVQADPVSIRHYVDSDPNYSLAHILGYTGIISSDEYNLASRDYKVDKYQSTDVVGQTGIESGLDQYLHGVNGTEEVEVDAGERPVRVLSPGRFVPGDDVYLTLDWNLQRQVSQDLHDALAHLGLRQGVAVVENVHNGQILAMVSLPSFNNNWFTTPITQKRYDSLLNDPAHPLNDLATAGEYPPGSTYKIVTAAGALQSGTVNGDTTIDDTGLIDLGGGTKFFGWTPPPGLGPVNVVMALAKSSDIYFYSVVGGNPTVSPNPPHMGGQTLAHYARLFGLGQPTGIEIPGEAAGFVPSPSWYNHLKVGDPRRPTSIDHWTIGYNYNSAIGQGFDLATPLQMANVTATIANGGTLYQPHIVEKIVGRVLPQRGVERRRSVIQPFVPTPIRRNFISPANLSLIQQGMHLGVSLPNWEGTSLLVQDPRIDAAGKTGTAESGPGRPPHAWWVGYAPYNNPQVAVCVMVPFADGEGAYVAAPIAHKVLEDYFHLPPTKPNWLDDVAQILVGTGGAQ